MKVKEFIAVLKALPQDASISYGMTHYRGEAKPNRVDIELYDLFDCDNPPDEDEAQVVLWCEE